MRGVVWVAFGKKAQEEAAISKASFLKHNKVPTRVLKELSFPAPEGLTIGQQAHWAKANADKWSPFDHTLMLDADTRVQGDLSLGFKMLQKGWEIVMVQSIPPKDGMVLWTIPEPEREETLKELGTWLHGMFNTGVIYFNRTEAVQNLFQCWRKEWLRFKGWDQAAFLRALRKCPVSLWLLGPAFNSRGGEVVNHLFGRAR